MNTVKASDIEPQVLLDDTITEMRIAYERGLADVKARIDEDAAQLRQVIDGQATHSVKYSEEQRSLQQQMKGITDDINKMYDASVTWLTRINATSQRLDDVEGLLDEHRSLIEAATQSGPNHHHDVRLNFPATKYGMWLANALATLSIIFGILGTAGVFDQWSMGGYAFGAVVLAIKKAIDTYCLETTTEKSG